MAPSESVGASLVGNDQLGNQALDKPNPALALPPVWVDTLDEINQDIKNVKIHMKELTRLYDDANRIGFDDKKEAEVKRKIQVVTNQISHLFRHSQNLLKKIASIGNTEGKLPFQERLVRLNVMRGKAAELQELTKQFRHLQKGFLGKMSGRNRQGQTLFGDEDDMEDEMTFERKGFSDGQMQQIAEMQKNQNQRSQEIMQIVKSVEELAQIFNELQILIVQQGTVLDRIDYNVEQTLVTLEQSKGHLSKAQKYQKRSMSTICIFALIILIFLAGIILVAQNAGK